MWHMPHRADGTTESQGGESVEEGESIETCDSKDVLVFGLKEVFACLKEELGFLKVFDKRELTSAEGFVEQEHVVGAFYGRT